MKLRLALWRTAFWLALAVTLWFALTPLPVPLPVSDKWQHMAAFATLSVLAAFGYPAVRLLTIALALAGFGAAIEFFQLIPALHRSSDWRDWIADVVAILVPLAVVAAGRGLTKRNAGA